MYCLLFVCLLPSLLAFDDVTQYEFIEDTNLRYLHHIGSGLVCEGTLDKYGTFQADWNDLVKAFDALKQGTKRAGPFPPTLVEAKTPNEKVYEFRNGVLAPMIIDAKRGLIPEVGGSIMEFKKYKYHPGARRIYNLPGRFVLKGQK